MFASDGLDVRVSKRLERVRAFSAAIDMDELRQTLIEFRSLDLRLRDMGIEDVSERLKYLSKTGPITFSDLGQFTAEFDTYEERVSSILSAMVEPEPATPRARIKRSHLLSQMKHAFRSERVLATRGEDLGSHRIVPRVEMDEGLVADLVLKNGAFHVVETVDASGEVESPRRTLGDIGISALVLERARMKYGAKKTQTRLVYSASAVVEKIASAPLEAAANQGALLTNWLSADDRGKFIHSMSSLAEPLPLKRRGRRVIFSSNMARIL